MKVKALVPFALKLLESICYNLPPKFATVNPKCIGIPEEGSLLVSHSWKSLTVSSSAALALQIRYDLGIYNFFVKQIIGAKQCFAEVL